MERGHLGEFEELVLLISAVLNGNAYGISVMDEILSQTGRKSNISAVHTALDRLEKKSYLRSKLGGATSERGGRSKRYFEVTDLGMKVIEINREVRNSLYNQIPGLLKT